MNTNEWKIVSIEFLGTFVDILSRRVRINIQQTKTKKTHTKNTHVERANLKLKVKEPGSRTNKYIYLHSWNRRNTPIRKYTELKSSARKRKEKEDQQQLRIQIVIKARNLVTESIYENVMFIYVMANVEADRRIDRTYLRDVGGTFVSVKLIDKSLCNT